MTTKVTRFLAVLWMSAVWLVAAAGAQSGGQANDGPYGDQSAPQSEQSGDPQNFPRSGQGGDPQLHYPPSGQPPSGQAEDQQSDRQPADPQATEQKNAVARISMILSSRRQFLIGLLDEV